MRIVKHKWGAGAALIAAMTLAGCTLDAVNPGAITEEGLQNELAIAALVNGVIGDYDEAYQRSALYSGLLSDEYRASGSWTWWHDADKIGFIDVNAPDGDLMNIPHHWWNPLSRARFLADETYGRVQEVIENPGQSPLTAMVRLYSGMAYRDIGQFFCVAAYDGGPPVQREQSLQIAKDHLTEAIQVAQAAGVDSIATMAYLQRARINLVMGDLAAAVADAQMVPDGFIWYAHFRNAAGESNDMVFQTNQRVEATVQEPFRETGDPRVPVEDTGEKGADNLTPRWDQMKYGRYENMVLGKWQEARLIEAEVLLSQGQVEPAIVLMNEVRAAAGLEALSTTLSAAEAQAALRQERKYELFLDAHRMIDMRRWGLFPDGWGATCSPLPRSETDNNVNF
ncbi:MAG TPA: RagB/SusD family nutrient uptake outer membrane protein [Longimicrobiaceae bacterium]|nr:RagB/SusD family nutrient uptake outer membrane protein [Longimicrobiaceae bacterium]